MACGNVFGSGCVESSTRQASAGTGRHAGFQADCASVNPTMGKLHHSLRPLLFVALILCAATLRAQAPEGPMTPVPGVVIQQAPPESKFKVQSILVTVPVTVRNVNGEM